jgi:CBS domain containing-hemolysin-like protein
MLQFSIALVFLTLALVALVLRKTYFYLPKKELQRQAAQHDPLAATLWRATAYGGNLQLLLWTLIGLGAGVGFGLFARVAPPVFGFLAIAAVLWFGFAWIPNTRLTSFGARLAVWCTPSIVWLLSLSYPVSRRATQFFNRFPLGPHTGVYEREDFLQLVKQQKQQADNRMSDEELDLVARALKFDEYTVHDVFVPRSMVKKVSQSDPIGPVLMDELHGTNHVRFPVYGENKNVIVGTLFLRDIVDSKKGGTVAQYADEHVFYVHENDSLSQTLHAFRAAKQQILIVVNSSEEFLGIVTVSDVLQKLITIPDGSAFTRHDDKKAVAHKHETVAETTENLIDSPEISTGVVE